jgi:hypothetical protein
MSEKKPKIGAGLVKAMLRAGFKEAAQALVALPTSTIRPVEEPGMIGNLTPAEVVQSKGPYESMLNKYSSPGQERMPERQASERQMER